MNIKRSNEELEAIIKKLKEEIKRLKLELAAKKVTDEKEERESSDGDDDDGIITIRSRSERKSICENNN